MMYPNPHPYESEWLAAAIVIAAFVVGIGIARIICRVCTGSWI